ncbi:MAG: hypothetical protein ACKVOI_16295 [Dongiaceae bacterium]
MRLSTTVMAVVLLAGAQAALAEEPNLLKPYLYQPPPAQLSPLEQQKALIYRSQVRSQLNRLQSANSRGELNAYNRRLLLNTRAEQQRIDGILGF